MQPTTNYLFIPGLRGHVADHWQTLLANTLPNATTIEPLTENRLSCRARVEAIADAVNRIEGEIVIVAHSAGVMMLAHWAPNASRNIRGALLVAPPDLEKPLPEGYPRKSELDAHGWNPIPLTPLPFPSIVVASSNDPLAELSRVEHFAACWGSELFHAGNVGHLNPASGHGPWPLGGELLHRL